MSLELKLGWPSTDDIAYNRLIKNKPSVAKTALLYQRGHLIPSGFSERLELGLTSSIQSREEAYSVLVIGIDRREYVARDSDIDTFIAEHWHYIKPGGDPLNVEWSNGKTVTL